MEQREFKGVEKSDLLLAIVTPVKPIICSSLLGGLLLVIE
jgi:hypothetical protein